MRLTTSLRQVAAPIFNRTITPECEEKLKVLLENGWTVSKKRTAIEKGYQFNTFSRAMKFMRYVAKESQGVGHHPEWANVCELKLRMGWMIGSRY